MNILIAEDNLVNQMLSSMLMEGWGYSFDVASNGLEAVELAQQNKDKYDLCLMDIEMPEMNGLEAARLIRKNEKYFPIAAYSSNHKYREQCLNTGFDEFIKKPALPMQLFNKIKELTIKAVLLDCDKNNISIKQVTPMDSEQLKLLIELEKKDLALLIIEQGPQRFVVHKNIQNKMSHVLIGEGKELFEFLDRGENPANCHLYKFNLQTNRLLLTPEQFEQRAQIEDSDIENYTSAVDLNNSSENKE